MPATYAKSEEIQISNVAGMKTKLRTCLAATGYSTFFPVQAVAWELLGGGMSTKHDLCINAPTGSGKTLAYVLPILQRCLKLPHAKGLRALVVVPTRVLASQVLPQPLLDTATTHNQAPHSSSHDVSLKDKARVASTPATAWHVCVANPCVCCQPAPQPRLRL